VSALWLCSQLKFESKSLCVRQITEGEDRKATVRESSLRRFCLALNKMIRFVALAAYRRGIRLRGPS
jgi:hypothetical protein